MERGISIFILTLQWEGGTERVFGGTPGVGGLPAVSGLGEVVVRTLGFWG